MQHCKYSLNEIEMMIPWEREVYLNLLQKHMKEEQRRQAEAEAQQHG